MSLHPPHLRELVIRPTLEQLGFWSEAAENLLMGTAAQESRMGMYLKQLGGGPALGVFQMEPATHDDIWINFVRFKPSLADLLRKVAGVGHGRHPQADLMIGNLYYAAAMARVHYLRRPEALPPAGDVDALGQYWKNFYNTFLGKGTVEEFVENYHRHVGDS